MGTHFHKPTQTNQLKTQFPIRLSMNTIDTNSSKAVIKSQEINSSRHNGA